MMLGKQLAMDVALAWREVEAAEALLADVREARERRTGPDLRDVFGRRVEGLQLGIPSGENSHRLFNVAWGLAEPIIEAHIAQQHAKIALLTAKAREEIGGAA